MKKKFTFKFMLLLCALIVGSNAWATDVITTFKNKTSGNWEAGMTLPCENGGLNWATSAAPSSFESASPARGIQYSKVSSDITTTITDATITKVVVVASTNANANVNSISVSVGSTQIGSTQNMPKENNKTYTFESSTGLSGEIKVSMSNDGSKSTYIKSITVTYTSGGGSTVATPTFSPAAGTYNVNQSVTIACETADATIYYTTDGTNPTSSSTEYSSAISISQNTTLKAIAIKDATSSSIATATYTLKPVTPTFSPVAGTYFGAQNVSITSETAGVTIHYTIDGSTPTSLSPTYSSPINITATTTVKAIAVKNNWTNSDMATAVYTIVAPASLPFAYDGNGTGTLPSGFTVSGLGTYNSSPAMQFNSTGDYAILGINERPGTLTFDIKGNGFSGGTFKVQTSEDGETYTDLGTYTELGDTQNESFDNLGENVRYIKWIYTNKSSGNVALGNITLAKLAPSISADDVDIDYNATGGSISFTVNNPIDGGVISASVTGGDWITIGSETTSPISFTCSANDGDERTATVRLTYTYNTNETKTKDVTITQAAAPAAPGNWVLTSLKQLTPSDVFVIVGKKGDAWYAITNDKGTSNPPVPVAVTMAGNTLSGTIADNIKWNISGNATDGYTFYPNGDEDNWLFCNTDAASSSNENIRVGTGNRKAFVFDENDYLVTNDSYVDRYLSIYNTQDWRGYINTASAVTMSFYKYVAGSIITKDIDGYGEGDDKWYLIASPITSVASSSVAAGTYDLYRFNPTADDEWINYKAHKDDFTTLNAGTGYLYANKNNIHISFVGTPYNGNGKVNLPYESWNLIGNPWNTAATIGERDYYRINDTGTDIVAGTGNIAVMEGIFVKATSTGETVTFTAAKGTGDKSVNNALVINLNRNDKVIDRAIVRFGESEKLGKFQLFEGSTKIYIPQNGADYAIAAMDDNTQAFSLNFHAKTTGKYNLSLGETSNLSYIHLFDRMTGEDVDMLLEDSYSFIGSPADSEERFIVRLSYNASSAGSETFAYQSGNGIIVNGEGELQIFDITGRKVMTTTINGVQTVNGLNNGLYIFKLNEKTQKIVVR